MTYAIVGVGRSGEAAKRLLLHRGIAPSEIATFDEKSSAADFTDPVELMKRDPRVLIVSPGVPLSRPWIREAAARGVEITSELSLALGDLDREKIVGVTGSVGKSTTVALVGEAAKVADPNAFVGGNFGVPLCRYALDIREGRPRAKWLILELSSFQLENCEGLAVDVGAITSLTSNHLERYESREHYYRTKWSLAARCRRPILLNAHGGDLIEFAKKQPGPWTAVDRDDPKWARFRLNEAALIGTHNQDNLALAAAIATEAAWPDEAVEHMKRFQGLAHRLQALETIKGVRFVNDSKATALDSVWIAVRAAVESLPAPGRVLLMLGGRDKGLPWETMSELAKFERVKPIFFGEYGANAKARTGLEGPVSAKLADAVEAALREARAGDLVLLSPGGSSWDEFKSFEERGEAFARLSREKSALIR